MLHCLMNKFSDSQPGLPGFNIHKGKSISYLLYNVPHAWNDWTANVGFCWDWANHSVSISFKLILGDCFGEGWHERRVLTSTFLMLALDKVGESFLFLRPFMAMGPLAHIQVDEINGCAFPKQSSFMSKRNQLLCYVAVVITSNNDDDDSCNNEVSSLQPYSIKFSFAFTCTTGNNTRSGTLTNVGNVRKRLCDKVLK